MTRERLKVPGSIYRNGRRWWWSVKLPGESKRKSRPLIPAGSDRATPDHAVAVEIARQQYRAAIRSAQDTQTGGPVTVAQPADAYERHAATYYRRANGERTQQYGLTCRDLDWLRDAVADMPADDFGPRDLKAIRERMIAARDDRKGLARTTVNKYVAIIRRMFKWAAADGLVPASSGRADASGRRSAVTLPALGRRERIAPCFAVNYERATAPG